MIRKATKADIPKIKALTEACAQNMINQHIYQWNEHYPSRKVFENDVEIGQLYCLDSQGSIEGIIVLSDIEDQEYQDVIWSGENGKKLYIHRLAVHPSYQKKGNARKLMDFAENYAKQEGYSWVRLDTFSQNKRNHKFYEARGYKRLGNIFFPKQSEHPFYCYDLPI
ncbi:GNAT family N-acetyltransferase [Flavobacteriaceae bacterium]|nr:GNAT family N-acetyltransferase [Flavobacteriaceae bacterium]